MTAPSPRTVTDLELHRALLFLSWETLEAESESSTRLRRLESEFRRIGWIPSGKSIPNRAEMSGAKLRLWWTESPKQLDDGWLETLDAISQPEELLIYVGRLRREDREESTWTDWIDKSVDLWKARYPDSLWSTAFAPSHEVDPEGRPRLYGQAWIWTGEWNRPPDDPDGWEGFGRRAYGPGRYTLFPWGLLGHTDVRTAGFPRLDLHATADDASRKGRDQYLRWELPNLLMAFLKGDQFLAPRAAYFSNRLHQERDNIEALADPNRNPKPSAGVATRALREELDAVGADLHHFTNTLATVERECKTMEIALDETKRALPDPGAGRTLPWMATRLDRIARQLKTDAEYGRITSSRGERMLQRLQILAEIEETKATERLTKVGMAVGAVLSAMQLTSCVPVRVACFTAGALLCAWLYRDELRKLVRG